MSDKFNYTYNAPTQSERREIENIKKQYQKTEFSRDKLSELRKLNKRAKLVPSIISITAGIAGTLIFGLGMAMILEWNFMLWGAAVGIAGFAVLASAYPLHVFLFKLSKKKYADRIIALSDELMHGE